jgi:hypothetical protein
LHGTASFRLPLQNCRVYRQILPCLNGDTGYLL